MRIWQSDETIPEDGASVQIIVRSRKANGEIIERMLRSFQIGEHVCIGIPEPRNRKKQKAIALASIERWRGKD
jgi:hypothetical protein